MNKKLRINFAAVFLTSILFLVSFVFTCNSNDRFVSVLQVWKTDNAALVHADVIQKEIFSKGPKIIIAVIDSGINTTHKEIRDIVLLSDGYDFVKNSSEIIDEHGHGTHIAGIIKSVVGEVNKDRIKLMSLRYYSSSNKNSNLQNSIKAINLAVDHGAKIINYSGGGSQFSEKEYTALKRAEEKGVIVVAAAGNNKSNVDVTKNYYFPASYDVSNVISVSAMTRDHHLLSSSNWGARNVDLAAPGENIISTAPNQSYYYMSGTSQATAFVTGVVALLLQRDYNLTPQKIKQILIETSDRIEDLKGKNKANGCVNAHKAVQLLMKNKSSLDVSPGVQ